MSVNEADGTGLTDRPDLSHYPTTAGRASAPGPDDLTVSFFGTSSMLIRAGSTALMVDGFFSRPSWAQLGDPIAPDPAVIDACLERAGVHALDAVVCVHSHYDHALDAPLISAKYRAPLIGSGSTANIGRGYGLPEDLLRTVRDGESLAFDDFEVTLIESVHCPGDLAPGRVEQPVVPPAPFSAWQTGECWSLLVRHASGTTLVQASANFVPGKLSAHSADAVYLGVGMLGQQPSEFREAYWNEVVGATGARAVFPVHWDDFATPLLGGPLPAMPTMLDDVVPAMDFVFKKGEADGVTVLLPEPWTPFAPFA
ncbi:MBL fold metallo-hydrolase [Streptomyces sp. NPDC052052]|uniref:MBL fold metallo-hydrolase n=1 Tax=Streptomyces sp. NPDC052052 TaxID=3154756 RepID=UPI0034153DD4